MNRTEARLLLLRKLFEYRRLSYERLAEPAGETDRLEVTARSGRWYQIDGSIDDAGCSAFCPMSFDFLAAPGYAGRPSRPNRLG